MDESIVKQLIILLALMLNLPAANAARWTMHPDKSRLTFMASQEGVEFEGSFVEFSVGLEFDPAEPVGGSINAIVQLASVDTGLQTRDDYLRQPAWFGIDVWPAAVFKAEKFRHLSGDQYVAEGFLTLKGISQPVQLIFLLTLGELRETAVMTGSARLQRLDFDVGAGEWGDTSLAGNTVVVEFELSLLRSFEN